MVRTAHRANRRARREFRNVYATLEEASENDSEMNSDFTERSRGQVSSRGSSLPEHSTPTAGPFRADNGVAEYYRLAKKQVAGGAWLQQPEIPSPSELLPENSSELLVDVENSLRPHKAEGAYDSNDDYLGTKYELIREDALSTFRNILNKVRKDPYLDEAEYQEQSIGVYDPVHIKSVVFSPRGLATRVAFSLGRVKKHIRWAQSKRLVTGSLVALSPADDAFQTKCVLAVVAGRPISALEQNPPEIDLFFARTEDQEIDPIRKWMMVECRASFFEASRHTMMALQHMMREPFPMSKYLVSIQEEVEPPAYIKHNPYLNLSSLVSMEECANYENVNVLDDWPSTSSHSLDKSQSKALQRILTSELAIVQGPPGTGKTFVSVVALQIARDNLRKDDPPIIVTAQTNHALDQLLRHTSQFEPNYIRLGGRSKDNDIKKRTLFEVRSAAPQPRQPGSLKSQASNKMRALTGEMQTLLAPIEANKGPLDHKLLLKYGLITTEQAESLVLASQNAIGISPSDNPGITMEIWLGRRLVLCDRPIDPEQFDWGYEEEDFEMEQLKELEAEAVAQDDDDIEALRGPVTLLSDNHKGVGASLSSAKIEEMLRKTEDLHTISVDHRGAIYNYFKRQVKRILTTEIRKIAKAYQEAVVQRKIGFWEEDVRVLREARIIGCTTTGLAKYRPLLCALRPRMCVVEEAAETLEAPVTTACFPSLEHLVLVGDHQQLRPHTQVKAFEDEPYFLNLSLFERLVRNSVAFDTLTRQRRMVPEIRRLLYPIYQNTLKDHKSVMDPKNRPPVEGMGGNNSFFFCHEWEESRDANMSAVNQTEAEMVVRFFDYLVLNGIDAAKITILTFYNGQRKQIIRLLIENANLRAYRNNIQVVTVDSYQGEENDIVLLSLVRSNRKHSIGFLSSENRACVALSRAKRGFYIFGNAELLACESDVWAGVVEIMFKNKKEKVAAGQERRVGYYFPLQCSNHGRKVWCEVPSDFELIMGGCDLKCEGALPCGHRCPYMCHPFEHNRINCTQKCSRRVETCGHPCVAVCCDPCQCQMCERRSGGVKSTLKPAPNGATSLGASHTNAHDISRQNTFRTSGQSNRASSKPIQCANTPQPFDGSMQEWKMYTTGGGAQQDDARVLAEMRKQEAQYLERVGASTPRIEQSPVVDQLIPISPTPAPTSIVVPSENTHLLLELDMEPQMTAGRQQTGDLYGATASSCASQTAFTNLLD